MGKAVIWVFLDRFLDFLVVLFLTAFLLLIVPTSLSVNIVIIILLSCLGLTYIAIFQVDFAKKLVIFLSHLLIERHIKIYFEKFSHFVLDSFSILKRHPKDFVIIFGLVSVYSLKINLGVILKKALRRN